MRTLRFEVTIELTGFDDPQEASTWLDNKLTEIAESNPMEIFDVSMAPYAELVDYSSN